MDPTSITNLVVWYVVFLFSTTLHEASHSIVAARLGDRTAEMGGQATLNPLPHIRRSPVGMVVMPLLTFFLNGWMIGWASAPYNPYWANRHPGRALAMSLAGPASHILPATFAALAMVVGIRTGFFDGGALSNSVSLFVHVMLQLNVLLFVFNLLPIPPLDGSEIWTFLIKSEEGRLRWRLTMQSYALAGLLLAWYMFDKVFPPVWGMVVRTIRWLAFM